MTACCRRSSQKHHLLCHPQIYACLPWSFFLLPTDMYALTSPHLQTFSGGWQSGFCWCWLLPCVQRSRHLAIDLSVRIRAARTLITAIRLDGCTYAVDGASSPLPRQAVHLSYTCPGRCCARHAARWGSCFIIGDDRTVTLCTGGTQNNA